MPSIWNAFLLKTKGSPGPDSVFWKPWLERGLFFSSLDRMEGNASTSLAVPVKLSPIIWWSKVTTSSNTFQFSRKCSKLLIIDPSIIVFWLSGKMRDTCAIFYLTGKLARFYSDVPFLSCKCNWLLCKISQGGNALLVSWWHHFVSRGFENPWLGMFFTLPSFTAAAILRQLMATAL